MNTFWTGFEKQADKRQAIAGTAGLIAGLLGAGALVGHLNNVSDKVDAARRGMDHKEKSFIQKNPKLTGALSLGLAPAISSAVTRRERDLDSGKVRDVLKKHPFAGPAVAGHS